jgi:geranylgeranyl pyrophosphate synthase
MNDVPPSATELFGPVKDDVRLVDELLASLRPADFPFLARILDHVLEAGGKRIRPAIALLCGRLGDYQLDKLVPMAASIEGAATRRGRSTANALFDNAATVMVGDYMFAHAAELVSRTGNIDVVRLFARTLMAMTSGELNQDMSAYNYSQSTREYFGRIAGKTASLFAAASEGAAIVAGLDNQQTQDLRSYGENLGMAFQVVDDILDFTADESELGKPAGSDLMHGTLTLPSLLLIEHYPDDNPVKRYFAGRNKAASLRRSLEMIRESDILDESYGIAHDFRDRAIRSLNDFPDDGPSESLVDLAYFVTQRRS